MIYFLFYFFFNLWISVNHFGNWDKCACQSIWEVFTNVASSCTLFIFIAYAVDHQSVNHHLQHPHPHPIQHQHPHLHPHSAAIQRMWVPFWVTAIAYCVLTWVFYPWSSRMILGPRRPLIYINRFTAAVAALRHIWDHVEIHTLWPKVINCWHLECWSDCCGLRRSFSDVFRTFIRAC